MRPYSKYYQLLSEVKYDIPPTVEEGRKWHVNFSIRKTYSISFNCLNEYGGNDEKRIGLFLKKNCLLLYWDCMPVLSSSSFLPKLPLKNDLSYEMSFF